MRLSSLLNEGITLSWHGESGGAHIERGDSPQRGGGQLNDGGIDLQAPISGVVCHLNVGGIDLQAP